ncbi:MAG: hypothetical protein M8349_08380 [ANME-2 cluster archaeon]|nr:hypothetical protein [ANME-2 cluster archaeon]
MDAEEIEFYLELINGIVGILIFIVTLIIYKLTHDNPNLIRSYFFLKGGNLSKPFLYLMMGMLIWGIREFSKVLELRGIIDIGLFYEITELISATLLFVSMIYFLRIAKFKMAD